MKSKTSIRHDASVTSAADRARRSTQHPCERAFGAGVPQGQAKRQHFTPQLVLRRFLAPGATRLRQLDVTTGQSHSVSVSSAASRRRFYTLRDAETDERDETIEGLLSLVEDAVAPALETVIGAPASMTADERVTLAYCRPAQLLRTPSALERIQAIGRVVQVSEMARLICDTLRSPRPTPRSRMTRVGDDPAWLQNWMREALLDDRIRVTNERELSLRHDDRPPRRVRGSPLRRCHGPRCQAHAWHVHRRATPARRTRSQLVTTRPAVSVLGSNDARLLMPIAREYCLQIGPIGRATTGVSPTALTPKQTSLVNLAVLRLGRAAHLRRHPEDRD